MKTNLFAFVHLKSLKKLDTPEEVRRRVNTYSLNAKGYLTAISISQEFKDAESIKVIVLDDSASELQYLSISGIETLQQIIFNKSPKKLSYLDLSCCSITEVSFPAGLEEIQQIYLHHNNIHSVHFETDCPKLTLLDVANNQLTNFNLSGGFNKLSYLYLSDNRITEIVLDSCLSALNTLNLRNNKLTELPENFLDFNNLEALYLHGNPLPMREFIPDDSRRSALEGARSYLISLKQGAIINTEAKIILVGNGNSGKTTLSHQLRKNEFIKDYNTTHGIMVEKWEINLDEFPDSFIEKIKANITSEKARNPKGTKALETPEKITINLWDFGGQEYYHATHRLFLNNNIIYLLLWDEDTNYFDDENGIYPYHYWEKNINHYAPINTTFLIQNKLKGKPHLNESAHIYSIGYREDKDKHSIFKYEEDISKLRKGILNKIAEMDLIGKPFPKVYDDIRNELKNCSYPYITFEYFESLCRNIDKTHKNIMKSSDQIETLTKFLHDTGAIICYKYHDSLIKSDILKNYVFVKPSWVTDIIYRILEKKLKESNGMFDYNYLLQKLQKLNFTYNHFNPLNVSIRPTTSCRCEFFV